MKKIFAALVAMFMVAIMFAPSASATGNGHGHSNKKIDICHATASKKNPYTTNRVSTESVTKMGHDSHNTDAVPGDGINGDIIPSFTYKDRDENGDVVEKTYPGKNWPAGQAILENGCKAPDGRTPVTKPEPTYADPCGIKEDVDLAVAGGTGYTVGDLVKDGRTQTITVTLNGDDYVWADGTDTPLTFSYTFTSAPCDLPETGGVVTNVLGGAVALALLAAGGLFLYRRRGSDSTV